MKECLNKIGKLKPQIEVYTQPPQSPDMNVNDLALFRALDSSVHRLRQECRDKFNREILVDDVKRTFKEYPRNQIESIWVQKEYVMSVVCACNGGNEYPRHHPSEE